MHTLVNPAFFYRKETRVLSASRKSLVNRAFSLVEIVVAIGLLSFVLVSLLGLMPIGFQALKSSVDDSITVLIFQDAQTRIESDIRKSGGFTSPKAVDWYYNKSGHWLGTLPGADAYYHVTARYGRGALHAPSSANRYDWTLTIIWPLVDGKKAPNTSQATFVGAIANNAP